MHSPATIVAADRRVVRGVLLEALEQQQRKKEALQDQLDKVQQAAPAALCADDADDEDVRKRLAKAARRAEQVPQHLAAVAAVEAKLEDLLAGLGSGLADAALLAELDAMGLGPRLATLHNLHYYQGLMQHLRAAIEAGEIADTVAAVRARYAG